MQAVGPPASIHHAPGEFIDNDDFVVLHDVICILSEHDVGAQRLVEVMNHLGILEIVEIGAFEQTCIFEHPLHFFGAVFG